FGIDSSSDNVSQLLGRFGMLCPSQLPAGEMSKTGQKTFASSGPGTASISSRGQTENLPSTPSLSASWLEKKGPARPGNSRGTEGGVCPPVRAEVRGVRA